MKLVIIFITILVLNLFFVQGVNNREMWSEKGICKLMKGCYSNEEYEIECFPYGYRKEGQYCYDKVWSSPYSSATKSGFINQSKAGESCENGFECVSNFCFNGKCVGQISSAITSVMQRILIIESKLDILQLNLDELKNLTQEENITINQTEENKKRGIIGFIIKMFN